MRLMLRVNSEVSLLEVGFTLIELLVVIAVIGVLATVIVVVINPTEQLNRAKDAGRKSDLRQIADAIEKYNVIYGHYPTTGTWCGAPGSAWSCGTSYDPNGYFVPGVVETGEISKLPQDPDVGKSYSPCFNASYVSYLYYSNGTDYKLLAHCGPGSKLAYPTNGVCSSAYPLCDPVRPTWAWQISSPGGINW